MYSLSAVDAFDQSTHSYKKLKDVVWTGLPAPVANYTYESDTVYNIAYSYEMYAGYLKAKSQSNEVPHLVRSEFGEGVYQRALLRLNGEY